MRGGWMLGGVVFGVVAMVSRHLAFATNPLSRPFTCIVCEANKLQEGYWDTKTTRLGTVLATRQGTLESVWLWVVHA
jgi:hypothetical protein